MSTNEEIREEVVMPEVAASPTPTTEEMPEFVAASPSPTTEEIREVVMPPEVVSSPTPTEEVSEPWVLHWPWILAVVVPVLMAGLSLINKRALAEGMDFHVLSVYRNALAFLVLIPFAVYFERASWQHATRRVVLCVVGLAILEPVMDQTFLYVGLQKISVSLASSFGLVQPVLTFILSLIFRYEHLNLYGWPGQVKVSGTIVALVGAVVIVISPGNAVIPLPWTKRSHINPVGDAQANSIEGIAFCFLAMLSSSFYNMLVTRALNDFLAPVTITAGTCLVGAVFNFIVAQVSGSGIGPGWIIVPSVTLMSYLYSGVVGSALITYLVSVVIRARGPVFMSACAPLSMVLVTIVGTSLGEQLFVARIVAICCIVLGMSLLLWGKTQEARIAKIQEQRRDAEEV